jgi:glycosyltransferase involved in cell wall biosynthesis
LVDRVYLLSHGFQTEYEAGFANGVSDNGLDVVMVGSDQSLQHRLRSAVRFMNLRGSQDPARTRLSKAINLFRYLWAYALLGLKDRSAVFHFNGLFTVRRGPGVLLEALFARLVLRRWWLSVHNILPHDAETPFNRWMFGQIYRLPNLLIVHTQPMAQELIRNYGVCAKRVVVVEHGVDRFVIPTPSSKAEVAQRFQLPSFERLVLAFGHVAPYKGPLVLLDALQAGGFGPGVLFLMVGRSTTPAIKEAIAHKVTALSSDVQFRWVDDYIDDDLVPTLLGAADLMVLPYIKIDQSGVVFAAKSAGLPIIASDVGTFRNYVREGRDGLISANDSAALRNALLNFCADAPESVQDRARAVRDAQDSYAWKNTLKHYCSTVRQLS